MNRKALKFHSTIEDVKDSVFFDKNPHFMTTRHARGVCAGDYDGDGWDDLVANQNFFPMQPETGRLNGGMGLLLLGDGKGGFKPLMECESGILFKGDGRALLAQDLNGDSRPDLLASFNSGKPKALINQSHRGTPLCLKISGDPGNLRGTGSRLLLVYRDGRRKSCQLSLGSSYLSSPEPQVFL